MVLLERLSRFYFQNEIFSSLDWFVLILLHYESSVGKYFLYSARVINCNFSTDEIILKGRQMVYYEIVKKTQIKAIGDVIFCNVIFVKKNIYLI
jgi:hypothetical protein